MTIKPTGIAGLTITMLALATTLSVEYQVDSASGFLPIPRPAGRSVIGTPASAHATGIEAPLYFEANQGQTADEVRFVIRDPAYTLFLTENEAVFSLRPQSMGKPGNNLHTPKEKDSVVRLQFSGSQPPAKIKGLKVLPGKSHYFIGNDPAQWHAGVPHYAKVKYESLYPGVDIVYYGKDKRLEYDFVVAPGADPTVIRLAFDGVDDMTVDDQGDLVLETPTGKLVNHAPGVYQEINGTRHAVESSYEVKLAQVSFRIAEYDHRYPLIIDPGFTYASYLGGAGEDQITDIAADDAGNFYVTGWTGSSDFPTTSGAVSEQLTFGINSSVDVFVSKFNTLGELVYSTYLGGSDKDLGYGIAADASGRAYITGVTKLSFPPLYPTTAGAYDRSPLSNDAFLSVLNTGGSLAYSTLLGGYSGDEGWDVVLDNTAAIYLTGRTNTTTNTPFPTTAGAYQTGNNGFFDVFVAKFKAVGSLGGGLNDLVFATLIGGSGSDEGRGIAVDDLGNAYVTGITNSADFPSASGSKQGKGDGFIAKIDNTGATLVYAAYIGGNEPVDINSGDYLGPDADEANAIAVDGSYNAYITGKAASPDFPTINPYQSTLSGTTDAFVAKYDSTGMLVYSTFLGGTTDILDLPEEGKGIAVDSTGNMYITGRTTSSNFPTGNNNNMQLAFGGGTDAFVTKIGSSGTALGYSTFYGGSGYDAGNGIALNTAGNLYVAGVTGSTGTISSNNAAFQSIPGGGDDGFVLRIGSYADMWGDITDNEPVTVGTGGNLVYTVRVRNYGPDVASGVVMTATLSANITYVSDDHGCSLNGVTLTCSLGSMSVYPASEEVIGITTTVGTTNQVSSSISVTSNEYDADTGNNTNTEPTAANTTGAGGTSPPPGGTTDPPTFIITDPVPSSSGGGGGGMLSLTDLIAGLMATLVVVRRRLTNL